MIATYLLSGCATVGSDGNAPEARPPVFDYSREFQVCAAEELVLLPEWAAIEEMLSDYTVMREQARVLILRHLSRTTRRAGRRTRGHRSAT